jgi:hypothetical protein
VALPSLSSPTQLRLAPRWPRWLRIPPCSQPAPHGAWPCSMLPTALSQPAVSPSPCRFPESLSSSTLLPCAAMPSSMASFVAYYHSSHSVLRRHLPSVPPGRSGRPVPSALNPMCAATELPREQTYSRRGHALPLCIPPVPRLLCIPGKLPFGTLLWASVALYLGCFCVCANQ